MRCQQLISLYLAIKMINLCLSMKQKLSCYLSVVFLKSVNIVLKTHRAYCWSFIQGLNIMFAISVAPDQTTQLVTIMFEP